MNRVLLVSPAFHGYWRSVAGALERRGHEVRTCRYDEHGGLGRARHWVRYSTGHEDSQRLGRPPAYDDHATRRAVAALAGTSGVAPEAVVVIKGDVLGPAFWDALDAAGLPRVVWLYDELRRMRYAEETLARVGPVASYSRRDVAALTGRGVPATYLPLAHDPHLGGARPATTGPGEVVFVGAAYPRRVELLTGLASTGVPVRSFGRDWSRHPVDRLRTWGRARPDLPAGRDLPRPQAYAEMAAALATLNVHGDQDGFSMRTFEACGAGAVQLVDRVDVVELYEPDREVLVFDGLAGLVAQVERLRADPDRAAGLRRRAVERTLAEHTFDHRVAVLEQLWSGAGTAGDDGPTGGPAGGRTTGETWR